MQARFWVLHRTMTTTRQFMPMKILHTADLHLGQVMYQNYTREEEHDHFFRQLKKWCGEHRPDALVVSGDIFDIQQPGAGVKRRFNEYFVDLHNSFPDMAIVITAGNHDSASRIHADNAVWSLGHVKLVGLPPATDSLENPDGWQEEYVVSLPTGFVVAMPFAATPRREIVQSLLDYVSRRNPDGLPVVLMGHMAVTGVDTTGHGIDIGNVQTVPPSETGTGFDYLALGHIHRPQTLGYADEHEPVSTYPAGVMRYSGSALHVSCDEKYPHGVSLVEIDRHGGDVKVTRLGIDEKFHFFELPAGGAATTAEEALEAVKRFTEEQGAGYFRLVMDYHTALPADFNQQVYQLIEPYGGRVRYNPKTVWLNADPEAEENEKPLFEVAELQQMTDPMEFIRQTQGQYPELDMDELADAFREVEAELRRQVEETNTESYEN